MTAELYAQYDAWKGWENPFTYSADEAAYYAAELAGRPLKDARVLEIGFGGGAFLAWAHEQGATISGSEVTPAAIKAAEAEGVPLLPGDFTAGDLPEAGFDLVAAFDVFEHLNGPAITAKLAAIARALTPGGWLILRYPNGQSPFGLIHQHGDATHISALSRAKIEQYATGLPLRTLRYGGAARASAGGAGKRALRSARYALRDLHKRWINFAYATDAELEPVVTHVLVKQAD